MSTYNLVLSKSMKNIRVFLSENFQFLDVKFSIYLNRRVFVMAILQARTNNLCLFKYGLNDFISLRWLSLD